MSSREVEALLRRHSIGAPLYSLNLTNEESQVIVDALHDGVSTRGLGALTERQQGKAFVVLASEFLAMEATKLQWAPILAHIGVQNDAHGDYSELYDCVEDALRSFGRDLIVANGRRMFLATLLREGGLPTHIGNLPELIQRAVSAVGWSRLTGTAGSGEREAAVLRIRREGGHSNALSFLNHGEGRQALEDLLREAADIRAELVDLDVDPTTLTCADDVAQALMQHGLPTPNVRNPDLLNAILVAITHQDPPEREREEQHTEEPTLVLRPRLDGTPELRIVFPLSVLSQAVQVPLSATHVTLRLEPDASNGVASILARRTGVQTFKTTEAASIVQWPLKPLPGPRTVTARFPGSDGGPCSVTIATVSWPADDVVWLDAAGRMITESRETLQVGERLILLTTDSVAVAAHGQVRATATGPVRPFAASWQIEADGAGSLDLLWTGNVTRLTAAARSLAIEVANGPRAPWSTSNRVVVELPTIIVSDGGDELTLEARLDGARDYVPVRHGIKGRVQLSRIRGLARAAGNVGIRVLRADGAAWAATWWVLPTELRITRLPNEIRIQTPTGAHISPCAGHTVRGIAPHWTVVMSSDHAEADVLLTLANGDCTRLLIPSLAAFVRLCDCDGTALPTDGSATIPESMIARGAFVEVCAAAGSSVVIETRNRMPISRWLADRNGRVSIPLSEVVTYLTRAGEARIELGVRVDGRTTDCKFSVHVPRLDKPKRIRDDQAFRFQTRLDPADLPRAPAVALFDVVQPFAVPALVDADMTEVGGDLWEFTVAPERLPTTRARCIGFLVDRSQQLDRPMSGGLLVDLPIGRNDVPLRLGRLQQALWDRDSKAIVAALSPSERDLATNRSFIAKFVEVAPARARYGIRWFEFFDLMRVRAPWILLAAGTELQGDSHRLWVTDYVEGTRCFSWLRLRRSGVQALAHLTNTLPPDVRMGLIQAAKGAARMPTTIELMLLEELFTGPQRPLAQALAFELLNVDVSVQPLSRWDVIALPTGERARKWVRGGAPEDAEDEISALRTRQIVHAGRLEGLRSLFARLRLASGDIAALGGGSPVLLSNAREAPSWLQRLRRRVMDDWRRQSSRESVQQVAHVERAIVEAAALSTRYHEGELELNEVEWAELLALENLAPVLLDAWLATIRLILRNEGSL